MKQVKVEDLVEVLKYHGANAMLDDDEITVWKGDHKRTFPIEDNFISKKFVQQLARLFEVPPHHFYNPEVIRD